MSVLCLPQERAAAEKRPATGDRTLQRLRSSELARSLQQATKDVRVDLVLENREALCSLMPVVFGTCFHQTPRGLPVTLLQWRVLLSGVSSSQSMACGKSTR